MFGKKEEMGGKGALSSPIAEPSSNVETKQIVEQQTASKAELYSCMMDEMEGQVKDRGQYFC